jgi:hypothetical protein
LRTDYFQVEPADLGAWCFLVLVLIRW